MTSLTREQVRAVDRIAIEEFGVPGVVLMENAGLLASLRILEQLGASRGPVAVLCGGGNNGGDGYVIARQLANRGVDVLVFSCQSARELGGDAAVNRAIVERMGLAVTSIASAQELDAARAELARAEVLVDALLGTGFRGAVRPELARVIDTLAAVCAESGAQVVAIDLPSGLDCDTGEPTNATVRADLTLTFVARKAGFDRARSERWTGAVEVVPIGAPKEILERVLRNA